MRKIGINVDPNISFGVAPFLTCIKNTGFDCIFTGGTDPDYVGWVSDQCKTLGLEYEMLHAPWDHINDLWFRNEAADVLVQRLCDSVSLAAQHKIPIVVMHLSSGDQCPHVTDAGLENFDKIVKFAAARDVTVAVENQRKLGNISTVLEIYGKETNVGFCWDVGHEACFAHGREYMPLFADRCVTTHIHDNHCRYNGDDHLIPFDGQIDFRRTADLIHKANYQGTLMLELDLPHEGSDKYNNLNMEQFVSKAFAAINRLRIIAE